MNSIPLVSVIIPTYKRPVTLLRAVKSVLQQTYNNIEIIIVDDNNDGDKYRLETEQVYVEHLAQYANVKYIKHSHNMNGSAARNTGFRNSEGGFIMFLDDDDEFSSRKIEAQVRCLNERDKSWGACYTRYIRKKNGKIVMKCAEQREGYLMVDELARNLFVHAGSNLMIRREVFEELNGFDESFLRNQDVELLVRILQKYKLAFVDELGLIVNVHPKSCTVNLESLTEQYLEKFSCEICKLDLPQQTLVKKMIALQLFRDALVHRKIRKSLDTLVEADLTLFDGFKYIAHLAKRRLMRISCGYDLNKIKC